MAATSLPLISRYYPSSSSSSSSSSVSSPRRHHKNQTLGNKNRFQFHPETTPSRRICLTPTHASQPGNGEPPPFVPQEDLKYLVKLGAGSVVGAVAIKYGSIILPGITQPNLFQALSMITLPVLLAVWLLIRQSNIHSD